MPRDDRRLSWLALGLVVIMSGFALTWLARPATQTHGTTRLDVLALYSAAAAIGLSCLGYGLVSSGSRIRRIALALSAYPAMGLLFWIVVLGAFLVVAGPDSVVVAIRNHLASYPLWWFVCWPMWPLLMFDLMGYGFG